MLTFRLTSPFIPPGTMPNSSSQPGSVEAFLLESHAAEGSEDPRLVPEGKWGYFRAPCGTGSLESSCSFPYWAGCPPCSSLGESQSLLCQLLLKRLFRQALGVWKLFPSARTTEDTLARREISTIWDFGHIVWPGETWSGYRVGHVWPLHF